MGYGTLYEKDLLIEIDRGVVISEQEVGHREEFEKLSEKEKYKLREELKYGYWKRHEYE